jgi:hypothetical protein
MLSFIILANQPHSTPTLAPQPSQTFPGQMVTLPLLEVAVAVGSTCKPLPLYHPAPSRLSTSNLSSVPWIVSRAGELSLGSGRPSIARYDLCLCSTRFGWCRLMFTSLLLSLCPFLVISCRTDDVQVILRWVELDRQGRGWLATTVHRPDAAAQ